MNGWLPCSSSLPIVDRPPLYSLPKARRAARGIGAMVAALSLVLTLGNPHAPDDSLHWLSRPFVSAFHFGYAPISYWIVLLLAVVTFSGPSRCDPA